MSTVGNLRFKIDWASLIVGSKFTFFPLIYFVSEGAYIWRGDLTEGFLRYRFGGLIFGGAHTWRGLFLEFYGSSIYQAPVVQKLDSEIGFPDTYPLNTDLSGE